MGPRSPSSLPFLLLVSVLALGMAVTVSCYKQYSFVPSNSSSPTNIASTQDPKTIAFTYGNQVYTANGRRRGTVAVPNYPIPPPPSTPPGQWIWNGNVIVSGYYDELMTLDENGSPVLLKDLDPNSTHPTYPRSFTYAPATGGIIFIASAQEAGIWLTDGTAEGTRLLHQLPPTQYPYNLAYFVFEVANLGIFVAMPGSSNAPFPGGTLYYYDVATDTMHDTPLHVFPTATYFTMASTGDRLVFAVQGDQTPLWGSDGTPEGTVPLSSIYGGAILSAPGKVFFLASTPEEGEELWETDGTAAGTRMVRKPSISGPGSSKPGSLTVIDNRLYFSALTRDGSNQVHMLRIKP